MQSKLLTIMFLTASALAAPLAQFYGDASADTQPNIYTLTNDGTPIELVDSNGNFVSSPAGEGNTAANGATTPENGDSSRNGGSSSTSDDSSHPNDGSSDTDTSSSDWSPGTGRGPKTNQDGSVTNNDGTVTRADGSVFTPMCGGKRLPGGSGGVCQICSDNSWAATYALR